MTRCFTDGITVGLVAAALLLAIALTPGTSAARCDGGKEYISITSPLTGKKYYTFVTVYGAGAKDKNGVDPNVQAQLDAEADKARQDSFSIAFEDDWPISKNLTVRIRPKFRK